MDKILQTMHYFYNPEFIEEHIQFLILITMTVSFLEVVFPVIPGDTALIICGSLAGVAGYNPILVIGAAFLGSFTASVLLYFLGLKLGRRLLDSTKLNWFLDSRTFLKIEAWFNRYGFLTVFVSRLLPVCRSGIILAAGIVKMRQGQALIAVGFSTIISTTFFVLGGRLAGKRWYQLVELWNSHMRVIIILLVSILIAYILFAGVKKIWKKR